jgi:hypothetical protein
MGAVMKLVTTRRCGTGQAEGGRVGDAGRLRRFRRPRAIHDVPTDTPSPSPSNAGPSVDPAAAIGQTVLTSDQVSQICQSRFADGNGLASGGLTLMRGGKAALTCQDGEVLYDVFTGTILWSRDNTADSAETDSYTVGPAHIFVVETHQLPAIGLDAAYTERYLDALDPTTGATDWSQQIEGFVPKASRSSSGTAQVTETVTPAGTTPDLVVVQADATSAFDGATGTPAWHTTALNGTYEGFGLSLDSGNPSAWTCYDDRTGHIVWTKPVPDVQGDSPTLTAGTVWQVGRRGIIGVDLRTGRLLLNRVYPSTWTSQDVTPTLTVAYDGSHLAMFNTSDLNTPLWSVASDAVTPLAVSPDLVVVDAAGGLLALDGHTGAIRSDITVPTSGGGNWQVVDGLSTPGDGSVYELSPPGTPGNW